jgi:hypothetical protein
MNILYYNDLPITALAQKHGKIISHLQQGEFNALDIKKMPETGLYRVKLDYENRLLFKFAKYNNESYLLLLEMICNHNYSRSRFLRGKDINENNLLSMASPEKISNEDALPLPYINSKSSNFHLLDKFISFDDDQQQIFSFPTPLIIIGSAGSGKTALTLEKIKTLKGNILYITLSPYLVQSSINLYYANHYENDGQEIDFLSFKEFLETLKIIEGREIDFRAFEGWFNRHRNATKIRDAQKLYEEFEGVISGSVIDKEYLSREEYLSLGIRQSVFLNEEREQAYNLFEKYQFFLKENNYYNLNSISFHWTSFCKPVYDFIVIDEVQDITNVKLQIILKSLKNQNNFILCGDSNQIVHPNFFSWSKVKSMFYKNSMADNTIKILRTNYRNSPEITTIANKLLKIKNARFGSIDRESTYLVNNVSSKKGEAILLEDNNKNRTELNNKTKGSARFAVVVMRNEDKAEARKIFQTPLLFSIHEAKGLEYENVILLNFVTNYDREFRDISDNIQESDISADEINYNRASDKADKSLDAYKFYVNSLYVAITRAVQNLYIVELSSKHHLLKLLGLQNAQQQINIQTQSSSLDDWSKEARKLELQGKLEQAEEIRRSILKACQPTPWKPITLDNLNELKKQAFDQHNFNKKAKDKLFDFALLNNDIGTIELLAHQNYKRAENYEHERSSVLRKHYPAYQNDNISSIRSEVLKYGINYRDIFNLSPLMAASLAGAVKVLKFLIENGADASLVDNFGKNALQIALYQSHFSRQYSIGKLKEVHPLVVTDNLKIKIDNRLIKIDNHKIEYFIINYLIALQSAIVIEKDYYEAKGIKMDDILSGIAEYPEAILPFYRKQRPYINAHFSKNEITRESFDNKKFYVRIMRGNYILNPEMEILANEKWVKANHLIQIDKIKKDYRISKITEQLKNAEDALKWEQKQYGNANDLSHRKNRIMELRNQLKEIVNANIEGILNTMDKPKNSNTMPDVIHAGNAMENALTSSQ